jgi:hypothetical protein
LFADGNDIVIAVGWIMHEDKAGDLSALFATCVLTVRKRKVHLQLIGAVGRQVVGNINSEMEIASAIKASVLTIDVDPRLIVDSTKI